MPEFVTDTAQTADLFVYLFQRKFLFEYTDHVDEFDWRPFGDYALAWNQIGLQKMSFSALTGYVVKSPIQRKMVSLWNTDESI